MAETTGRWPDAARPFLFGQLGPDILAIFSRGDRVLDVFTEMASVSPARMKRTRLFLDQEAFALTGPGGEL